MNQRQHVVHIIGSLHSGGIQSVVFGLAQSKSLANFKHSVVCVYSGKGNIAEDFRSSGIGIHECILPWLRVPKLPYRIRNLLMGIFKFDFRRRLRKLLANIDADLVHTHTPMLIHAQAQAILNDLNLPWAWTIHGFFKHKPGELNDWKNVVHLAEKHRTYISTVSEAAKNDLIQKKIATESQIHVIHPGTEIFETGLRLSDGSWRKKFGISSDAIVYGSMGRVAPEKGFDVFLKAAAKLHKELPNSFFLILGDGESRDSLLEEAVLLGLQKHFFILGFDNHPEQFLRELDVFVLPSRAEGFGLALVEAMSLGLPCIASDVGGIPEILSDQAGVLVPSENVEALAESMRSMSKKEYRSEFTAGPQIAKNFSSEICAQNYLEVYNQLINVGAEHFPL